MSIENKVAGSQSKNSYKEVKTKEERLYSSIHTDLSENVSTESKKSENSSNISRKLLANLGKNSNLEKSSSIREDVELTSLFGLCF